MAKRSRRHARSAPSRRAQWLPWLIVGGLALAAVIVIAVLLRPSSSSAAPVPWARLGTRDVHALAFPGPSSDVLLFGHHGGVLRSVDGGRRWTQLAFDQDAMALGTAPDGSIVVAGHLVFQASPDGGATWAPIDADLPSLDIHSFTRSVIDPQRMSAYLAEGGIYESLDGGRSWTRVNDGHVVNLTAIEQDGRDALLGIESLRGLVRSDDGGRTWSALGIPPVAPVTSVAATPGGRVILLGGPTGLYRSNDGGASWHQILRNRTVLAAATWAEGSVIAAVDRDTAFYRSDDGGASWPAP